MAGRSQEMAHMPAKFRLKVCGNPGPIPFGPCDHYPILLSIHGHYDGTAYAHAFRGQD